MRRPRMLGPLVASVLAVAVAVAGCDGGSSQPATPPLTAPATSGHALPSSWPTYHRDNARTGFSPDTAPPGRLRTAWHTKLDGAVYGQPLLVGGELLAATENDTVYALDPSDGAIRWSRHLGTPVPGSALPCGNIDPLGITSTMAYDTASGRVFALAETTGGAHTLYGLDPADGTVEVRVPVEPPRGDRLAHQQRSALTVHNGRVYVAYGGLFGDCANYIGSVVSVTTAGTNTITYAVPTSREGGIWSTAGAVVDGDRLLYAVGNGESTTRYDGSDSVIALSPSLQRLDLFAPSTWRDDNANDLDLGSSSPILDGRWIVVAGKRGTGYVLHAKALGGVGGAVSTARVCRSFGGSSVHDGTMYLPCTDGPRAVAIRQDGTLTVRWHATVAAAGSPVVGGGAIWVVDYHASLLYALDAGAGSVRAKIAIPAAPHFASPTLDHGSAYVGVMDGVVALAGV